MRHTINNFNIVPDKAAVARIGESISTLQQARELRMREAETSLKSRSQAGFVPVVPVGGRRITADEKGLSQELARQLGTLGSATRRADGGALVGSARVRDGAAGHAQVPHRQGGGRPGDGDGPAGVAGGPTWRRACRSWSCGGLDGSPSPAPGAAPGRASVEDEVLLRLKVYRSLGIELERDEKDGEWTRAVIRNDRKGRRARGQHGQEVFELLLRELLLADGVAPWHSIDVGLCTQDSTCRFSIVIYALFPGGFEGVAPKKAPGRNPAS